MRVDRRSVASSAARRPALGGAVGDKGTAVVRFLVGQPAAAYDRVDSLSSVRPAQKDHARICLRNTDTILINKENLLPGRALEVERVR
jgi:hypothetical protein